MKEHHTDSAWSNSEPLDSFAQALALRSSITLLPMHKLQELILNGTIDITIPGLGLRSLTIKEVGPAV